MKYTVFTLAAALSFAGTAVAADPVVQVRTSTPGPTMPFDQLDKDHDGTISKKEAKQDHWLKKNFKRVDVNHDGKIDKTEYQGGMNQSAPTG